MRSLVNSLGAAALAGCLVLGGASSANAAALLSITGIDGAEYDTAGVYIFGDINFQATDDDGGGFDQVQFQIFDDGVIKYETIVQLLVGVTGSVHFSTQYPGLIGGGAPGLGLALNDIPNGSLDVYLDPVFLPHYADPQDCRVNCGQVPEPGTLPLMLSGLSAIGLAFRRRR